MRDSSKSITSIKMSDKQAAIEQALLRRKPRRRKLDMFRASGRTRGTFYPWIKGQKTSAPLDRWAEDWLGLPARYFDRFDDGGQLREGHHD